MGKWEKFYHYYEDARKQYEKTHKEQHRQQFNWNHTMNIDEAFKAIGITQDSTPEQAKKAFHKLVLQFHPDKEPDIEKKAEATNKMQRINEAWEVISNFYENKGK